MKNKKIIPYGRQDINEEDIKAVIAVLKADFLTQGPKIKEFEDALCRYTKSKYAVVVANGTAALHLAVAALGIEKGKEGISSTNSFVASANCLIYNGLKPVFADINSDTYNIDTKDIKKRINKDTKLLLPVHFAGQPADLKEIHKIATDNNLYVIEDAAHAIGSKYKGETIGSCKYSDMTTFSFHPVKTITSGEGGAITTNDKGFYNKLLLLRSHGITHDVHSFQDFKTGIYPGYYQMQILGYNYRLTDILAALGMSQLIRIDKYIRRRREIVAKYNLAFRSIKNLRIPREKTDVFSAWHLYVLQVDFKKIGKSRKQIMEELRGFSIGTQVHYIPIHTQPFFKRVFNYKFGEYPRAEEYFEKALSIPLYPQMTDRDVAYVIDKVLEVIK